MDKAVTVKVEGARNDALFKEEYEVTITPDGDIKFFLKDGTWYDNDKSDLRSDESDPVRKRRHHESMLVMTQARTDYREYFVESDRARRAASQKVSMPGWGQDDLLIIARMRR